MKEDTSLGLRAMFREAPSTPVEPAKVHVEDKTVITFDDAEKWEEAAKERGLKIVNRGENGEDELFAEEEDITMIGYFKDNWGMLV